MGRGRKGFTLVEIVVGLVIMTVAVSSFVGVFSQVSKLLMKSKYTSLATNLAQEKIESLKNISYYRLLVTTSPAVDNRVPPSFLYDQGFYPREMLVVAGIRFDREVSVDRVEKALAGNDLISVPASYPDTGIKLIKVHVLWREDNEWKSVELDNLRENPSRVALGSTLSGQVKKTDNITPIAGALVEVVENPTWYGASDVNGNYSFSLSSGNFTIRIYKSGYQTKYETLAVPVNSSVSRDFQLISRAVGQVTAEAYIRDHLVISEICPSISNDLFEYVELFNPTTASIQLFSGTTTPLFKLKYVEPDDSIDNFPSMTAVTSNASVPSNGYFLIGNNAAINAVVADAVYAGNVIPKQTQGGVSLWDNYNVALDSVSWGRLASWPPPSRAKEGLTGVMLSPGPNHGGFGESECIERKSVSTATASSMDLGTGGGNAWDSNDNAPDWVEHNHNHVGELPSPAQNTTKTELPLSGTPAVGAYVWADDGLSSTILAVSTGYFNLTQIATGTWTVSLATKSFSASRTVSLTDGGSVDLGRVALTSSTALGYISGAVTVGASNIANFSGESVDVQSGLSKTSTNQILSGKNYFLALSPGAPTLLFNTGNANPKFTSASTSVNLSTNALVDFNMSLTMGGQIWGYVTMGGSPLPGVVVSAKLNGFERSIATSGGDGKYILANLSTGTYTIEPILESGESSSPTNQTITILSSGDNIQASNFSISGSFGAIAGNVTLNGNVLTTGVLVLATTSTIVADPPALSSASISGSNIYYSNASSADGAYRVPVRGNVSYNVYAWYTSFGGDTPSTIRKNAGGVAVSPNQTTTLNFSWP